MLCMFKDFRFLHFMASHRNNKKKVLQFSQMVCKYFLSSPFSTHRQAANAAQALHGILDSLFINIWMPHERNITTYREQKRADSTSPEENRSFVTSTLLNGRTSCWISPLSSCYLMQCSSSTVRHTLRHLQVTPGTSRSTPFGTI